MQLLQQAPAPAPALRLIVTINLGGLDIAAPLSGIQSQALLRTLRRILRPIPGVQNVQYLGSRVSSLSSILLCHRYL